MAADNVIQFPRRQPEPDEVMLCSVQIYRCGLTGRVKGYVLDMSEEQMIAAGDNVPDRLRVIGKWMQLAGRDMRAVANLFIPDDPPDA